MNVQGQFMKILNACRNTPNFAIRCHFSVFPDSTIKDIPNELFTAVVQKLSSSTNVSWTSASIGWEEVLHVVSIHNIARADSLMLQQ